MLIMIFFISLLALTYAPYNHDMLLQIPKVNVEEATAFSAFSIFGAEGQRGASVLLNQTTRMTIYNFVKYNPGTHFRALSNSLNMPIGVLQYHLGLLVNGGLVSTFRDGRYKRYFESKRFTETEMRVISILRHQTSGKILLSLLEKPQMTHKELATNLNISSQALSWQMNRLKETDLIKTGKDGANVKYSLGDTVSAIVGQYGRFSNRITARI